MDSAAFMALMGDIDIQEVKTVAVRLGVALAAGGVLGLDREMRKRPVGVRTYMMVSLGSAIYIILGMGFTHDLEKTGLSPDPTRLVQGLMGAIGFIGAGAIMQGRSRVGGIATAASLWVAGAVGLAAGLGNWMLAFVTAGCTAILLAVSRFMSNRGAKDRPAENEPTAGEDA